MPHIHHHAHKKILEIVHKIITIVVDIAEL